MCMRLYPCVCVRPVFDRGRCGIIAIVIITITIIIIKRCSLFRNDDGDACVRVWWGGALPC